MSDELGKMTGVELETAIQSCVNKTRQIDLLVEADERMDCRDNGAPGRAPMLSRAQCRAVLGPLLLATNGEDGENLFCTRCYNDATHAAARALLNLGPGEKSPLEED